MAHSSAMVQSPESFISALNSRRLREWYRTELGNLPRALYLAKAELLNDIMQVLDESSVKKLARFVKQYWRHVTQRNRPAAPKIVRGMEVGILLVIPYVSGPVVDAACSALNL